MNQRTIEDIKNILILGSGTLGLRVGLQCAISGLNTTIFDIDQEAFPKARKIQEKLLEKQVKMGVLDEKAVPGILAGITWTSNRDEAVKDVDFVNESVTENLELKRKVWSEFGPLCPAHAILTTNTSYLLPSQMSEASGAPERFCAFHFHDVFFANVVDVMPHPGTLPWIPGLLMQLGELLNQTPVLVKKEYSGYIFNAMLIALIGAAGKLATLDVASIHDIDRSWMGNFKMPLGPFGILDEVGLDTAWHITHVKQDEASQRFADFLKLYIDQGKLGVKTGEGFYQYPHPKFKEEGFIHGKI